MQTSDIPSDKMPPWEVGNPLFLMNRQCRWCFSLWISIYRHLRLQKQPSWWGWFGGGFWLPFVACSFNSWVGPSPLWRGGIRIRDGDGEGWMDSVVFGIQRMRCERLIGVLKSWKCLLLIFLVFFWKSLADPILSSVLKVISWVFNNSYHLKALK